MNVPLTRIYVDDGMRRAVERVLSSGRFVKGEENARFEEEFARYTSVRHAVAASSGTAALHLAVEALGLRAGDEVLVPSFSFFATVSPLLRLGARPVFVDIDPHTYTIDPTDARRRSTRRTKGILPVHLYGHPSDMAPLMEFAEQQDLWVLEDACQAHGSLFNGRPVGSLGHLAAFSFYPSKNMTVCGDGGMVTTNNDEMAEKVRMLADAGRRPSEKYVHRLVGWNFRMSEMHAAIGREQLNHLDEWVSMRRRVADGYARRLAGISELSIPIEMPWARHSYYVYTVRAKRRKRLIAELHEAGIAAGIYYPTPIHRQPAVKGPRPRLPETDRAARQVLSLPMFPEISDTELDHIGDILRRASTGA